MQEEMQPDRTENDETVTGTSSPRLRSLDDMGDYGVAEGDPDIRSWDVFSADGIRVGRVHDLIIDTSAMEVRYMDVELDSDLTQDASERHVLLPIGTAKLSDKVEALTMTNVDAERIAEMPGYDHRPVTRDYERQLRARILGTSEAEIGEEPDFYGHDQFDTMRFWGHRAPLRTRTAYLISVGRGRGRTPPRAD